MGEEVGVREGGEGLLGHLGQGAPRVVVGSYGFGHRTPLQQDRRRSGGWHAGIGRECSITEGAPGGTEGALPASAEFLRRLDVAGITDEPCPVRKVAHLAHGQTIEVLVANRLPAPAPLVRVGDWAREWADEEVFGIEADLLDDDRIARALDAVAPEPGASPPWSPSSAWPCWCSASSNAGSARPWATIRPCARSTPTTGPSAQPGA
ncbi:DUF4277 domain-containing protein [Streptomyces sp. NPDC002676]